MKTVSMTKMEDKLERDELQKKDLKIQKMLQVLHSKNLHIRRLRKQRIGCSDVLFCSKDVKLRARTTSQ